MQSTLFINRYNGGMVSTHNTVDSNTQIDAKSLSLLYFTASITPLVALVVSLTLLVTVICAKLIGGLLPLFVGRVGLDPAVMAGPFITTLVDALSLLVYFALASALLGL